MPDYFKNFACKCGACRTVCCRGWDIALSMAEYHRLIGLDCSSELRSTLDRAFRIADRPDAERYALTLPSYDGSCRLLSADGYCRLQRECGENVLPAVCRLYPRSVKRGAESGEAVYSASCENTVELLMRHGKPITFSEEEIVIPAESIPDGSGAACVSSDADDMRKCIAIMQNRSVSPEERAADIGVFVAGEARKITISELAMLVRAFSRSSVNMEQYGGAAAHMLGIYDDETKSRDAYSNAENIFGCFCRRAYEKLPELDIYYENLFVNHIFYEQFPHLDGSLAPADVNLGFAAAFALTKLISVCAVAAEGDAETGFADSVSALFRLIEHSDFYRTASMLLKSGHAFPPPVSNNLTAS